LRDGSLIGSIGAAIAVCTSGIAQRAFTLRALETAGRAPSGSVAGRRSRLD
jgi:hypothetical protein